MRAGSPNVHAPELQAESDMTVDPRFVDAEHDDFRLKPDTTLLNRGAFRYLGALPPLLCLRKIANNHSGNNEIDDAHDVGNVYGMLSVSRVHFRIIS